MKKIILFIIISVLFLFNNIVYADVGTYTYKATIENCYHNDMYFYPSNGMEVYVYEIFGSDFSIEVISGNRLRVGLSPDYSTTCGVGSPKISVFNFSNPSLNTPYTFTNPYTSYDHVYAYVFLSNVVGSLGSSNWGTSVIPPEPEIPSIPSVTIPDTDFYLFYDFATISDFDIFSDYDFTSFTDFEKLTITIIVNIFYLGFIGFCIYILAKGLYKMVSWVFR